MIPFFLKDATIEIQNHVAAASAASSLDL